MTYETLTDSFNQAVRAVPTWVVYILGFAQMGWLFWLGVSGDLGVEPIKELEHRYGLLALQLLIGGLSITLLRRFAGINLLRFRRAIGLMCFYFVCAHLAVWLLLDVQDPAMIWADIVKRPYITVGMAAFVIMIPLALTSNNWACRKLGRYWRLLHRLTYAAVLLGSAHYVMLVKGWQSEPILYLGIAVGLLVLRLVPAPRPKHQSVRST